MCSHANGVRPATLNLSTEMHPGSDGDSGGGSASSGESLPHDGVVPHGETELKTALKMRSSSVDPWTDSQPIQECTKVIDR